MADYLRRLVARASGQMATAPAVRPVARARAVGDAPDDIVEVLLPPTPLVTSPRVAGETPRLDGPPAGPPPHVTPARGGDIPNAVPPPPRYPTSEHAPEGSAATTVPRPSVPLLRPEPVSHATHLGPTARQMTPPPTVATPQPVTPPTDRPVVRVEERVRPPVREPASAPAVHLTPPEPAAPREPPPPAPQLHIGSIHVEVLSPPQPRPMPAPRRAAPAASDRGALISSNLLGQRFGLGQL